MPPKKPIKTDLSKFNLPTLTDSQRADKTLGSMISNSTSEPTLITKEKTPSQIEWAKVRAEQNKSTMAVYMPLGIKRATEVLKTDLGFPGSEIICVLLIDLLKEIKTNDEFQKILEKYKLDAYQPKYKWKNDLEKYITDTLGSPLEK